MRVVIDAGGRRVEVETADANMTPAALRAEALSLWRETAETAPVRVAGFQLPEPACGLPDCECEGVIER